MLLLGDLLESVEIVRVGEEAEKWNAIIYHFKGARNKRDIALKADAEAAMEKVAGFEKQKVVCVTIHSRGEGKQAVAGKQCPYTMKDR
jgi:peptidyl-prolyl cis-trans isomerase A (cyclophilin A)